MEKLPIKPFSKRTYRQMTQHGQNYRIFLSAAEPSADAHCAGLINALNETTYNFEFAGVGGQAMQNAGCNLLQNTVSKASMHYNSFAHVAHYYKLIRRISHYLKRTKPHLVIVCDSPAFNFHVAKAAKKQGIKTLFYVAPQLWAWASWRIRKLRKYCDKLCCILPFEQQWFSQRLVDTTFVGNPMLDQMPTKLDDQKKKYAGFNPENARFALLPGSRNAEINLLWPPMQQIAKNLKRKYRNASFTAVAVDEQRKEILKSLQILGFRCNYRIGTVAETAAVSDFAIVTSGSATVQVAASGCPMVIMYQMNSLLWRLLGVLLVKTKHLSLINILADKDLVPEFMPCFKSINPIHHSIQLLIDNIENLRETSSELIELLKPIKQKGPASKNVAQIACQMLKNNKNGI